MTPCQTCGGVGLIGGHSGQTPESYEEFSEPCPECAAPVAWQYKSDPDNVRWSLADNEAFIDHARNAGWLVRPLYTNVPLVGEREAGRLVEAARAVIARVNATERTYDAAIRLLKHGPWAELADAIAALPTPAATPEGG